MCDNTDRMSQASDPLPSPSSASAQDAAPDAPTESDDLPSPTTTEHDHEVSSPAAAAADAAAKPVDSRRLHVQLTHVEGELARNDTAPLSLQHLELFQRFLEGVPATDDDIAARTAAALKRVAELLAAHPLALEPRSADREGGPGGFAPLFQPLRRWVEKLSVWWLNFFTLYPAVCVCLFVVYYVAGLAALCTALAGYYAYIGYVDRTRPWHGPGCGQAGWLRHAPLYGYLTHYFPMRLVRFGGGIEGPAVGEGFEREGGFLFGLHPHGVQTISVYCYLTEACKISTLVGERLKFAAETLGVNFRVPGIREYAVALGFGNASKESITQGLTYADGASVVLVVGGAKESLRAAPHASTVALGGRYGFLKLAFQTGASVVPCWSFGENNVFDNVAAESPRVGKILRMLQKHLSFAPLVVRGRGVFNYSFGLVPYRRPITSVIGEPIALEKDANPSREKLQAAHDQYVAQLREMVDLYRDIYDPLAEDLVVV